MQELIGPDTPRLYILKNETDETIDVYYNNKPFFIIPRATSGYLPLKYQFMPGTQLVFKIHEISSDKYFQEIDYTIPNSETLRRRLTILKEGDKFKLEDTSREQ
jgi:hypothetical protein